jgi:asparagine synthase (glutamine-hydrolysing)
VDPTFLHIRLTPGADPVVAGAREHRMGTVVPEPAGQANGVFADWRLDGTRLTVRTDPLGFFPLFVFISERELCISPSLVTLVERGAPRDLDLDALGVFLRLGYYLRDATPFTAIRALPPARMLTWAGGEPALEPWPALTPTHEISRDRALDAFVERFRDAVRRRLPPGDEPYELPLSGGVDSRHIFLELLRQRRPPERVITGSQQVADRDITAAGHLAARAGIKQVTLGGSLDAGYRTELRKNRATSFCADEHGWYLPVADHLHAHTRLTYDGIGGDVLSGGAYLYPGEVKSVAEGHFESFLDRLAPPHLETVLEAALTPEVFRAIPRARALEQAADELRLHTSAANPIGSYSFSNTTRREISLVPHSLLAPLAVHSPFLDCDVIELLAGLPASLLVDRRFHVDAVRRAYPEVADVPFAKELPLASSVRARRHLRQTGRGLALHLAVHAGARDSRLLRRVPPLLRGRLPRGGRAGFNWRATYLLQLERLAASTPLDSP